MKGKGKMYLFVVAAAVLAVACKTNGAKTPNVPPLALLEGDSLVYVAIPVKLQKDLTVNLIHFMMPSIPESTIEKLAVKCDTLYAGIGSDSNAKQLEVSVKGDFPALTVATAFSKKNGWNSDFRKYDGGGVLPFATAVYSSESVKDVSLAFPSSSILCVSRDVDKMMTRYAPMPETVEGLPCASWLEDSAGGMRFYINQPARALPAIRGTQFESLVDALYGSVTGTGEDVSVDFFLKIKASDASSSNLLTGALVTLLSFSLKKAGVEVSKSDDYTIKVCGMKMKAEGLSSFLGVQ